MCFATTFLLFLALFFLNYIFIVVFLLISLAFYTDSLKFERFIFHLCGKTSKFERTEINKFDVHRFLQKQSKCMNLLLHEIVNVL